MSLVASKVLLKVGLVSTGQFLYTSGFGGRGPWKTIHLRFHLPTLYWHCFVLCRLQYSFQSFADVRLRGQPMANFNAYLVKRRPCKLLYLYSLPLDFSFLVLVKRPKCCWQEASWSTTGLIQLELLHKNNRTENYRFLLTRMKWKKQTNPTVALW